MKNEKEVTVETEMIGDTLYNKEDITPSLYFEYVKGLKEKLNNDEYDIIIDTILKMLEKAKLTKQTDMAKRLTSELSLALRELDAAKSGFDIIVSRKDIEKYIQSVDSKVIKIIELSKYEREIPDEVVEKIAKANEIFDELYVVFTDYTKKETKKVAKHRREKDPIVFGAFKNKVNDKNIYVEDRLFFIADWVEEKCDLTLEQICRDIDSKKGDPITYKISNPKDEESVKKILKSYENSLSNSEIKPVSLFDKVKKAATRGRRKKTTK